MTRCRRIFTAFPLRLDDNPLHVQVLHVHAPETARVGQSYVAYLARGNAAAVPLVGGDSQGVCSHGDRDLL